MTIEIFSFIIGSLLVVAGILGGGVEAKEVKIPELRGRVRLAAVVVGFSFICLGLGLHLADSDSESGNSRSKNGSPAPESVERREGKIQDGSQALLVAGEIESNDAFKVVPERPAGPNHEDPGLRSPVTSNPLAAGELPQSWKGTYVWRARTYPLVLVVETYAEGAFSGKMLFPENQNSIATIRGSTVDDFSDFVEQSKWRYVDGFPSDIDTWVKFTIASSVQGKVQLNAVYYAKIGRRGDMLGVSFPTPTASEPYTSFDISLDQ